MTTHTQTHQLQTNLTLQTPTQSPLTIHTKTLTLTQENYTLISSNLTFQITPQLYQIIDTQALFNLKRELRGNFTAGLFLPLSNIEITATLKPDFLPHLTPHITDLPTYIKNLNQQEPENPLLSTENWLALQVKQQQTGYRTFWDYLSPSAITPDNIDSEKLNHAMINFFQDWAENNLQTISNETVADALIEITQGFEQWIDTTLGNINEETIAEAIESIINNWSKLADPTLTQNNTQNHPQIFDKIIKFFTLDDWHFTKIKGEATLEMAFQGKNAQFTCCAQTREEQSQFVFYSLCPIKVPKPKRRALAEFTSIANCGTIIGNFELDFSEGEIRYKTSAKVDNSPLIFDLIKDLVYTNIWMMDRYLPGIISVINGDASPSEAIRLIEEIALSPPLSDSAPSNNLTDNQTTVTPEMKKVQSQPSPPTESPASSLKQVTGAETFRRLTTEEMLRLRERNPK
jgi:hypothetical protein